MIKIKKSEACFTLLRTLSYVWHFRFSTKRSSFWTSRYNQWRNKGGHRGPWAPGGTFWGAALCW